MDYAKNENFIKSKDDVMRQIDAHTVNSEIVEHLASCETNCPICLLNHKNYHNYNFSDYCFKKVKWCFQLFPNAMKCGAARQMFIQKYHAAPHVLIWSKYDYLADKGEFVLPYPCLEGMIENVLDECQILMTPT